MTEQDRLWRNARECIGLEPRAPRKAALLLAKRIAAQEPLRRALALRFFDENIMALIAQANAAGGASTMAAHLAAKGQNFGTGGHSAPVTHEVDAAGTEGGAGQLEDDTHSGAARPSAISHQMPAPAGGAGHKPDDNQHVGARPIPPAPSQPRRLGPSPFVQQSVARGLLDTYKVDGRPIGDMTGRDVREAARAQHARAGFLVRVANGVPDTMTVRRAWTDEDLSRFYGEARQDADRGLAIAKPVIDAAKPGGYSENPDE